jgi:TetR/AcrR family transcriptional repressor of nem operon
MAGDDVPSTATRKLTKKGQATRERIVAAASALTMQRGVAGTSTEDVQRAAGVSASQLYHYFADKRALIRAVVCYQTAAVLAAQQPHLGHLDSIEALHAWRDHIVGSLQARQCEGGCPLGSLAYELSETCPDTRPLLADGFAQWEAAIRRGLAAMRDRGELAADPDQLALALLAALQGGLLLTQARRDTLALEAGLDTMIAYIASLVTDAGKAGLSS